MKHSLFIRGALSVAVLMLGNAIAANADSCAQVFDMTNAPLHSPKEVLVDRCSVQVIIKAPFSNNSNPTPTDVILDRNGAFDPLKPFFIVVEQPSSNSFSPWSPLVSPAPVNQDGFIRWFCGTAAERSRCPKGTKSISARIGPNRCLQIACFYIDAHK